MFAALIIATAIVGSAVRSIAVGDNDLHVPPPLHIAEHVSRRNATAPSWLSPAAQGKTVFFVSNDVQNAVEIFDAQDRTEPGPIGAITTGMSVPVGVAVARDGKLYVANSGANTITEYARGQLTPSETLSKGLQYPNFIALSQSGYLAVANLSAAPYVVEFAPHERRPSRTLTCSKLPLGLAYDTAGNLYIADGYGASGSGPSRILRVAPGSQNCVDLGLSGLAIIQGLAIDTAGNIWVGDVYNNFVAIYPAGSTQPASYMWEFLTPVSLAFDVPQRHLYVADNYTQLVLKLPYGSNASFISWFDYVQQPLGVAPSRGPWIS